MTVEELEADLDRVIAEHQRSGKPLQTMGDLFPGLDKREHVSIWVPSRLLKRLRDEAEKQHMPFQSLMVDLLEQALPAQSPEPAGTKPAD